MWPGNIRELENSIERAVLLCEGRTIAGKDLKIGPAGGTGEGGIPNLSLKLPPSGIRLEELEKLVILEALRMHGWVQKDAADFLGISARTMNYKIAKHQIRYARWSKNRQVN